MTSTATATVTAIASITVHPSADLPGRLDVRVDGERVGSVKDGGHIVRNADIVAKAAGATRSSGYALNAERQLVATAVRLSA